MKLSERLIFVFSALLLIFGMSVGLSAQSSPDSTVMLFRGSDIGISRVLVSSNTGTTLLAADAKRPDAICFNNSPNTVWIGTTSATQQNVVHSNITNGFPVLSSGTFRLDGSISGALYATADTGVASVEMRCLNGLTR